MRKLMQLCEYGKTWRNKSGRKESLNSCTPEVTFLVHTIKDNTYILIMIDSLKCQYVRDSGRRMLS